MILAFHLIDIIMEYIDAKKEITKIQLAILFCLIMPQYL